MNDEYNNNDPIERFFRKKADDYDIQYKEEDWLKLETRLNKVDKQFASRRRRYMAAAAVILLFSILGYFTYEQQQTINQLNERLSNSENVTNLPDNFFYTIPDDGAEENQSNTLTQEESKPTTVPDPSAIASDETAASESENNAGKDSDEPFITENNQQYMQTNIMESSLVAIAKASPGFDGRSPAISAIRPVKIKSTASKTGENTNVSPSASENSGKFLSQQKISRFSTSVVVGPDLSTVGSISNFIDPGHKIGLSFEYNITQNLAISTGAHHTRVRYIANSSEYELPKEYMPYGLAADEIAGECFLIDIPISLKYDFMHFDKSRLYASAGFSSYIMLNEDYQFKYEGDPSQTPQRWHERTGTRHWMSNATISVGYEHDLLRNISIRAEPFLKVPIKEVGWGNVNLYSMGSFVSVNYKW